MFRRLASLFSPAAEPVNARRVAFIVATPADRAKGYTLGGSHYWKG